MQPGGHDDVVPHGVATSKMTEDGSGAIEQATCTPTLAPLRPASRQQQPQPPPTPPLVFTTQFASTPHMNDSLAGSSAAAHPLQVQNYSVVVGSGNGGSRRESISQLQFEDSMIKVTCRTRGRSQSPYLAPMQAEVQLDLENNTGNPYSFSYSERSSPVQVSTPTIDFANAGTGLGPAFPTEYGRDVTTPLPHGSPGRQSQPQPPCFQSIADTPMSGEDGGLPLGSPMLLEPLPPSVVHRALMNRCRFIKFPTNLTPVRCRNSGHGGHGPAETPAPSSSAAVNVSGGAAAADATTPRADSTTGAAVHALFIGQVRFETTPAELIWLVQRTTGACASHLESRGAGCYLLYCKSEADLQLVRSLHKRILFDIGGVWFARTAQEVDALCEHVALDAPLLSRRARLPRDSMVVEELKVENRSHSGGGGNSFAGDMPHRHHHHHHHNNGHARRHGAGEQQSMNTGPLMQQQQQRQALPTPLSAGAGTVGVGGFSSLPPPGYYQHAPDATLPTSIISTSAVSPPLATERTALYRGEGIAYSPPPYQ